MYLREQVSRRQVLRMLGGLALAAAVPRAGLRQAARWALYLPWELPTPWVMNRVT